MSDIEICPSCNRPKNFAKDISDAFEQKGLYKTMVDALVAHLPKVEGNGTPTQETLTKSIEAALAANPIKLPPVKVVHHGLQELKDCPSCKKELDAEYVPRRALAAMSKPVGSRVTSSSSQTDSRPRTRTTGLFGDVED